MLDYFRNAMNRFRFLGTKITTEMLSRKKKSNGIGLPEVSILFQLSICAEKGCRNGIAGTNFRQRKMPTRFICSGNI